MRYLNDQNTWLLHAKGTQQKCLSVKPTCEQIQHTPVAQASGCVSGYISMY